MPPVPVHIDAPITPQKPANAVLEASTTQQQQPPSYLPAQPGAPAIPAPTGAVHTPNRYQPPQPTRTTDSTSNVGPPPPQPGAVPLPPSQQQSAPVANIPPPPKAGEAAKFLEHHQQQQQPSPAVTTMPPQMAMSLPEQNYAPTHTTNTQTPKRAGGGNSAPTTLNFGAVTPIAGGIAPASHPPGYQQDTMAQEMSSAARAKLDAEEHRKGSFTGVGGVLGGGAGNMSAGGAGDGSMWDTVKGYANSLSQSAIEAEKMVWDSLNKKG
ncbi:hypothetical protein CERZMDRAFT_97687 [Cercospora zeae-maydis SCOH1-5]|uniref:Uncharacterized protein n=1 Tax=Cercospora zeae-maydis SCOH1-5 TaxID=717836 RepID=A0A6A6FGH3_9PEZI|nr:hypothetical protein CERZMDRAFT_97687 [Cercospora zeae-maydis SCOH1-5]